MEWIKVTDRLPEIPESAASYLRQIRVIGSWLSGEERQWAEFVYCERVIRGKKVLRFEWNGRTNNFPLTHWAIPEPPKN